MKTLLSGMPYKPSHEPQDVQEVWRKYGWRPSDERGDEPVETDYKREIERAEYLEDR